MDGVNVFTQFVAQHKPQLESSDIPKHLWEALHRKLLKETFDAGEVLQLLLIDYDDEVVDVTEMEEETRPVFALLVGRDSGIKVNDPNAIYLIDHAWTFRVDMAREQLESNSQLADRMCAIMGVDLEDGSGRVDKILRRIWKYCESYRIDSEGLSDEERQSIWYVMDEVGSAVNHSDEPNFRVVPFLYLKTQTTYSLLFPIRDCECDEQVTRDFVEYVKTDAPERKALLLPWRLNDFQSESFVQTEPDVEYFSSGHIPESLPRHDSTPVVSQKNRNGPLKVYAEYDVVRQHLSSTHFQLVTNMEEADILWLTHHFKDYAELSRDSPHKFINQFPYEYVITIKDLLSITARRAAVAHHNTNTLKTYPSWLPTTYNLKTELLKFVSYYQHRREKGLDNHWIVKPWNLARGLDTHITNNLAHIVRLPCTGPKIAQKYIERPLTFYRSDIDAKVKFDVRYVLLLKSVHPLEAYVYRKFFLRFANRAFSLDHFDDYQKHFTVMNYQDDAAELYHVKCEDFLRYWQDQYPKDYWSAIENDICSMLYELLRCSTMCPPPCGIAACVQSRALYAVDIMLEWDESDDGSRIQPKLLEVNWIPDCKRACDYYPQFFNDVFKLLFLNEHNDKLFRLLKGNEL